MNRNILTSLALCILAAYTSYAQTPMTLHDCMLYATENSLKIKSAQSETADAAGSRTKAILDAFTPSISAGTYAYSNFGRSVDPETNTYVSTTSFNNGYSISGGITLFNGFEAVNNIRISQTSVKMGLCKEQQTADELCLAVMEAYCNVLYYKQMSDILSDQTGTARESLRLMQRQEEIGMKGHSDVIDMEAELATREYQAVSMKNLYNDALTILRNLMYWPEDRELAIECDLPDSGFGSILSPSRGDEKSIIESNTVSLPKVAMAKYTLDNAKAELRKARWRFAPRLSLNAGWSTSYYTYPGQENYVPLPYMTQLQNNGGEYIQLSLSIPLYDRLGNIFNLRHKKNSCLRAGLDYEQQLRDVKAEVTRAIQDRDGAAAALLQADRRAEVQKEAYGLSLRKLEQGLISPLEFQKASDNWLNSNAERLDALLKYRLKRSIVDYYKGTGYLAQEWNN